MWFWFAFHIMINGEHLFMCFGEMSVWVLWAIFNCVVLFLSFWSSLYILDINPISDKWFANIFPILCFAFLLYELCLLMYKFVKFSWSPICLFFFCYPYLWCPIQEIIGKSNIVKLLACDFFHEFYYFGSYI